jgi:HK97 family phage major capsid protein
MDGAISARDVSRYWDEFPEAIVTGKSRGIVREVTDSIAHDTGRPCRGLYLPWMLRPAMSGLDSTTGAGGSYTVPETLVPSVLDELLAQSRVLSFGAQVWPGLTSNLRLATESSSNTWVWAGQNPGADVAQTDATFGFHTMTPKTGQATTSVSNQLLKQSPRVRPFLVHDIARTFGVAIDAAAINGIGVQGAPLGIIKTPGVNVVSIGATGGAAIYSHLCALEHAIGAAHADDPACAFLTTSAQRQKLRAVATNGTGSRMCWECDEGMDQCIQRPAAVSANVPSNLTKSSGTGLSAIVYGSWKTLVVGLWGGIEIISDPYSLKKQGITEITSLAWADIMLLYPTAFAQILDAS